MRIHVPTFAVLLITLLFVGWWSGVDYLEREFMPAFWFTSSLSFSAMISLLVEQLKEGA